MTEFEWKKKLQRNEVATFLRQLADGLQEDGTVEIEQDDWELKLSVAENVQLQVELEVNGDEGELEIELKWATGASQRSSGEHAADADESSEGS